MTDRIRLADINLDAAAWHTAAMAALDNTTPRQITPPSAAQQIIANLTRDRDSLRATLDQTRGDRDQLAAELEQARAELNEAVSILARIGDAISPTGERPEEALGTLAADVEQLAADRDRLASELDQYAADLRDAEGVLAASQRDLEQARADLADTRATLTTTSRALAKHAWQDTAPVDARLLNQTAAALNVALHHAEANTSLAPGTAGYKQRAAELDGCRIALQEATEATAAPAPGSATRAHGGRCPNPDADPTQVVVLAWHNFTGPDAAYRERMGEHAGPAHARIQVEHSCGWSVAFAACPQSWANVAGAIREHFGRLDQTPGSATRAPEAKADADLITAVANAMMAAAGTGETWRSTYGDIVGPPLSLARVAVDAYRAATQDGDQ